MATHIFFDADGRTRLQAGVDTLANAVRVTLGPRGRNVTLFREYGAPHITKDGVTVAQAITLADPIENMGAQLVRDVASKVAKEAGDGTTTATVLAQAIFAGGVKNVAAGADPMALKRGIDLAVTAVVKALKEMAVPVDGPEGIARVGTVSANNDAQIGGLLAEAMGIIGKDGIILVQDSPTAETRLEVLEGMHFDSGYISPHFVNVDAKMLAEYADAWVLVTDAKIKTMQEIGSILTEVLKAGQALVIIADDVVGEALATLVVNKLQNRLKVLVVKGPGYGPARREMLLDIAGMSGATLISEQQGYQLEKCTMAQLGRVARVKADADTTTLVAGPEGAEPRQARIAQLKALIENTTNPFDEEVLRERIAKISGGVAILHVGGKSAVERGEKKDRVDDALHATRAAVAEGVLPGGGIALLRAREVLHQVGSWSGDEATGIKLVYDALAAPLRAIVANAGGSPDVVIEKVLRHDAVGDEDYGYNAREERYEHLLAAGILDPAKVTRLALENAASVAGLLLTTACVVGPTPGSEAKATGQQTGIADEY